MKFTDVFSAKAVALSATSDASNNLPFVGAAFFPEKKKMGIDLKWIKAHKGLNVALKPSTFDAMATIRPRKGFSVLTEEMPLFRESMAITEQDIIEINRAKEANDPYLNDVLNRIYDDANTLVEAAEISAERMRMALIAPANGEMVISIGTADNTAYEYDYDPNDAWKSGHYLGITATNDKWSAPTTCKPLNDIQTGTTYLRGLGYVPAYIMMNTTTLNRLIECSQLKNAFVTTSGRNVDFIDTAAAIDLIKRKTGLTPIIYDKKYVDYSGNETKFYPDDYVTILPEDVLGNTYRGSTPEERTLMENPAVDVAVLGNGVAIATQTQYGPPVQYSTTVSEICLPSFENMDGIFVIKVN